MVLVFYFCLIRLSGSNPAPNKGLYSQEDYVEILDKDNFDYAISDVNKLWIIEFYAAWCGHCQHFAPIIRSWSSSIRNWGRLVSIGVIDCGNNDNSEICSRNGIQGYPTMKFFPPGPRDWKKKNEIRGRDVDGLIESTLDLISENISKKNQNKISFNTSDYDSFDKIKLNPDSTSVFVLDKHNSKGDHTVARRVAAELSSFNEISIFRINFEENCDESDPCKENNSICCNFKPNNKYPAIYILQKSTSKEQATPVLLEVDINDKNSDSEQAADENEIEKYSLALAAFLNIKTSHNWEQQTHIQDKAEEALDSVRWRQFDQNKIYIRDIESSIIQFLFFEIKLFPFQNEKFNIFKNILKTISNHYPPTSRNVRNDLVHLAEIIKNEKIIKTRQDWINILDKTQLNPDQIEYAACTGSSGGKRGYPCSLWTLFHFLVANSADDEAAAVVAVVVDIVTYFFGCLNCVENFKNEILQFPVNDVVDTKSAVLWLWRIHNSVNARLAGDESEDAFFPKITWPSRDTCPGCRLVSDESSFDEEKISGFLISRGASSRLVLSKDEILIDDVIDPDQVINDVTSQSDSSHSGVIWLITVLITICGLWFYKHYRLKLILKRNYRKFYHQM
jgi:thiol oxidase